MTWRPVLLLGVGLGIIIAVAVADRVPQDPLYHIFADQRPFAGIPNFMNVMSNLPFLLIGAVGCNIIVANREIVTQATRLAWLIFFTGIALTAFGSGYFHLQPNNASLVWDRIPMTIGFMSLVSIVICEYYSPAFGRKMLFPLLLVGVGSVGYWAYTESLAVGDLRPYAIVQFLPILLIPLTIILYKTNSNRGRYLWWMIGFYVAAKVAEQLDDVLYAAGNVMSGHTLKHLLAALAPASLLYSFRRTRPHR